MNIVMSKKLRYKIVFTVSPSHLYRHYNFKKGGDLI